MTRGEQINILIVSVQWKALVFWVCPGNMLTYSTAKTVPGTQEARSTIQTGYFIGIIRSIPILGDDNTIASKNKIK